MIYKNLTIDEITQLKAQAGDKATEIIDGMKSDINESKENIGALDDLVKTTSTLTCWEIGGISPSVGTDADSAKRLRTTQKITSTSGIFGFTCKPGYKARIYRYKAADDAYSGCASETGWTMQSANVDPKSTWTFEFTISDVEYYYRLTLQNDSDTNLEATDASNIVFSAVDWVKVKFIEDEITDIQLALAEIYEQLGE